MLCYFNLEIRSWNDHIHGRAAYTTQHLKSRFQLMLQQFPFVLTFSRLSVWYLVADFLLLFAGASLICWFHLIRPDNLYLTILGGLMFLESMWTILHLRFRFINTNWLWSAVLFWCPTYSLHRLILGKFDLFPFYYVGCFLRTQDYKDQFARFQLPHSSLEIN
jgi:hypothetical protein